MAIILGSARGDELGKATGGQAGDQTGKEVSTQAWYKHAKGWRVLRAKDPAKAVLIGKAMQAACDNELIGYDQYQRNTLYTAASNVGYDPGQVAAPCETDCSALVRVCCAYAGIPVSDFTTANQASKLLATGAFDKLEDADKPDNLRVGDILVTKTKGHTAVVVQADNDRPTLRKGSTGADVKTLQILLLARGYDLGRYGADGDFGNATLTAVKAFQGGAGLTADGVVGAKTWAALLAASAAMYRYTVTLADKAALDALQGRYGGEIVEV